MIGAEPRMRDIIYATLTRLLDLVALFATAAGWVAIVSLWTR